MIQFLIVAVAVFLITAHFWDVETAIKTGPKLLDYWMLAGLAILIIGPVINLLRFTSFIIFKVFRFIRGNSKN